MTRLGVAAALVRGRWIRGDVDVEATDGRLNAIALTPPVGSKLLVSGFIDRQINGFAGVDFRSAHETDYARVGEALLSTGVTRYHPTLYSSSVSQYCEALAVLAQVHHRRPPGAMALGAHLEGPFLSPEWSGAHDTRLLLTPDTDVMDALLSSGPVDLVTLAPELQGALGLIGELVRRRIRVALGHTDATPNQMRAAIEAGASMLTHCFNAHRRFSSRDPGPAGVALTDERIEVGLIADGVHVADEALVLAARAAGDRLVLVTDAIAPAGLTLSRWEVPGREAVNLTTGVARLDDGTIAGGVATMDQCIRKLISLGLPSGSVLRAAGGDRLRPGNTADLVVMDESWEVNDTLIAPGRGA